VETKYIKVEIIMYKDDYNIILWSYTTLNKKNENEFTFYP